MAFSDKELKHFNRYFKKLDKNDTDTLENRDVINLVRILGENPTNSQMNQLFDEFDVDPNGNMSFDEFLKVLEKYRTNYPKITDQQLKSSFERFDRENNGRVELNELKTVLTKCGEPLSDDEFNSLIGLFNVSDGQVSYEGSYNVFLSNLITIREKSFTGHTEENQEAEQPEQEKPPIDWEHIRSCLPFEKTDEQNMKRRELFTQIDIIRNGRLSLSEVVKGVRDVLKLEEIYDAKPLMSFAYKLAKEHDVGGNDDYITYREFRFFLETLFKGFLCWIAFEKLDADFDEKISLEEFKHGCALYESYYGSPLTDDPEELFKQIDTNGSGNILFEEFYKWACQDLDFTVDEDDKLDYEPKEDEEPKDDCKEDEEHADDKEDEEPKDDSKEDEEPADEKKDEDEEKSAFDSIDWEDLSEKLPYQRHDGLLEKRKEIFEAMDITRNGKLARTEVEKGIRDYLKLDELYDAKKVIAYAFKKAKELSKKGDDDLIEFNEFRFFLECLYKGFRCWTIFSGIDEDSDKRIDRDEFKKMFEESERRVGSCGIDVGDFFSRFDEDESGTISFDEYFEYTMFLDKSPDEDDEEF